MFFWLNKIHKYTPRAYSGLQFPGWGVYSDNPATKTASQNAVIHGVKKPDLNKTQGVQSCFAVYWRR